MDTIYTNYTFYYKRQEGFLWRRTVQIPSVSLPFLYFLFGVNVHRLIYEYPETAHLVKIFETKTLEMKSFDTFNFNTLKILGV